MALVQQQQKCRKNWSLAQIGATQPVTNAQIFSQVKTKAGNARCAFGSHCVYEQCFKLILNKSSW